jgi:heterotetrameric sarcosine oxidase gamma subunit
MAEFSPLARSSIAPAEPLATFEGWEISGARSEAPLRVTDCTPMAKVSVRADPEGSLARALGVRFGRSQRDQQGSLVIGSGPGEWLLLASAETAPALVDRIRQLAGEEFASAVDLTHGRALIRLTGGDAARLLAKLCAIDLSDVTTPDGSALRTSIASVVTDVIRQDEGEAGSYWLHCEWSSGQYLFDALLDAGMEFGIGVSGFLAPAKT